MLLAITKIMVITIMIINAMIKIIYHNNSKRIITNTVNKKNNNDDNNNGYTQQITRKISWTQKL